MSQVCADCGGSGSTTNAATPERADTYRLYATLSCHWPVERWREGPKSEEIEACIALGWLYREDASNGWDRIGLTPAGKAKIDAFAKASADESGPRLALSDETRILRVVIAGVPRAGKTTLANSCEHLALWIRHTDELVGRMDWSDASAEAARWMAADGPWVIEGMAVPRALRKALRATSGKPCDLVIWMGTARQELTGGQAAMGKGALTVFREIEPELLARGVRVEVQS